MKSIPQSLVFLLIEILFLAELLCTISGHSAEIITGTAEREQRGQRPLAGMAPV